MTLEHRPVAPLLLRLEGRYDRSSAFVFAGAERAPDGTRPAHGEEPVPAPPGRRGQLLTEVLMNDLGLLALTFGFFLLSWLYVRACEKV